MNRDSTSRRLRANDLFIKADKEWDRGNLLPAFRLFLAAANAGDTGAQVNVGYFYDKGLGVRRSRTKALYWYRRAYRRGNASAANNIGTIWRDEGYPKRALLWFEKAVRMGEHSSNLDIAKYYLEHGQRKLAIGYLNKVLKSQRVSEDNLDQARALLSKAAAS